MTTTRLFGTDGVRGKAGVYPLDHVTVRRLGAALVRASVCRTSALIRLDLPTLERPTMANSGSRSAGNPAASAALVTKVALTFTP